MINTIPNQVERFKIIYCTEQNNEHAQHNRIPFNRQSVVGHTEYERPIRSGSRIQKRCDNYAALHEK